ncbi:MAG: hypothetical protein KKC84_07395 [Candidatus Omnitrophica bacterium]|nr:hypothetical protein [Candidatus Omnitrophota bacterium]
MQRKIALRLLVVLAIFAAFTISRYLFAREDVSLPQPEDMSGQDASAFMPKRIEKPKEKKKKEPTRSWIEEKEGEVSRGTSELKLSGPVWMEE